jgi:hypothetical protein
VILLENQGIEGSSAALPYGAPLAAHSADEIDLLLRKKTLTLETGKGWICFPWWHVPDRSDILNGLSPWKYFIIIGHGKRSNFPGTMTLGTIVINDRSDVFCESHLRTRRDSRMQRKEDG